ncbi:MAG: CesT family type III secretion system chaperone [Myxococcales bacterium]|nr:CesT family type III secretion system chaperone [Myxococcales bacterium]
MPRNRDDIETFLHRLNRSFYVSESGTFIVSSGDGGPPIAVQVDEPIVLAAVHMGHIPKDPTRQLALFRKVLEFNTQDLAHAAYGLDGDELVLDAGLELENLDENELAAVLNDIELALGRHTKELRALALD